MGEDGRIWETGNDRAACEPGEHFGGTAPKCGRTKTPFDRVDWMLGLSGPAPDYLLFLRYDGLVCG